MNISHSAEQSWAVLVCGQPAIMLYCITMCQELCTYIVHMCTKHEIKDKNNTQAFLHTHGRTHRKLANHTEIQICSSGCQRLITLHWGHKDIPLALSSNLQGYLTRVRDLDKA